VNELMKELALYKIITYTLLRRPKRVEGSTRGSALCKMITYMLLERPKVVE
jgi:hypothetical protein